VNGGYGTGGGRGSGGRGSGSRGSGGRGSGRGQGRPPSDGRPRPGWDDPSWQQGRPGQGGQPYGQRPGQAPDPGQGYDQGYGRPDPRPGSRPQRSGAGTGQQRYPRTGPQPGPRTGPQPGPRGTGPQPGPRTGPQPGPRGTGPRAAQQAQRGYDPRGAAVRRAAEARPGDGYPADSYQPRGDYGGWETDPRDDSFLPGFGGRDDFDDDRDPRRGRGGRYADDDRSARDRRARGRGRGDRDDTRDAYDTGDREPRRPRRGPVRRLAPWVALLVILIPLVVGLTYVYHLYESRYHPADYSGAGAGPTVTVQVNSGDTAFSLGPRLVQLGVVASSRAFENAAKASTNTAGLEPGFYKLNHHMQASLAYAALLNPKNRVQLSVTIPEGKRVSQVVALLAKATSIPAADFQQVISNPAQLGLPSYAKGKAEGYLFPATYQIQPNETALQILQAMVQRYDAEVRQIGLASAAAKAGLTPGQVIIEASMVQAEGGVVSDYAKIARVIINRLHRNPPMKLQFDSVLLYGLNAYGINVTFKQIGTPGPYNDFQHAGLPPTPICNPGDKAIQGVLHPANGPWLFFLTKTGGASEFSPTPLQGQ
jgi:UPF0755 protein